MQTRRYTSEAQILSEIDKCRELAERHFRFADSYMQEVKAIQARNDRREDWLIDEKTKMAKDARKKAENLVDNRLKRLGEKLAEFKTGILPCIEDRDPSIPVRITPVEK